MGNAIVTSNGSSSGNDSMRFIAGFVDRPSKFKTISIDLEFNATFALFFRGSIEEAVAPTTAIAGAETQELDSAIINVSSWARIYTSLSADGHTIQIDYMEESIKALDDLAQTVVYIAFSS